MPAGATVNAHYNPANPDKSYLVYRWDRGLASTFKLACWLFGLAAALLILPRLLR
jgi:hypothetical protein